MNLSELKQQWVDIPDYHKHIHESFCDNVNADEQLKAHRDFVEQNAFGFGERSFQWMWKLIVDEMPQTFSFLEVGVFRFQIVSLIKILADREDKIVRRYCVTPLSPIGIGWESDYAKDGEIIHDKFGLTKEYVVFKGLSDEPSIIEEVYNSSPYDIVFIDGGHDYETVVSDLKHYTPLIKIGGLLVVDDAATYTHQPFGYFQGIEEVGRAVKEWENGGFEFQFNVVHNMVYKRVA